MVRKRLTSKSTPKSEIAISGPKTGANELIRAPHDSPLALRTRWDEKPVRLGLARKSVQYPFFYEAELVYDIMRLEVFLYIQVQ